MAGAEFKFSLAPALLKADVKVMRRRKELLLALLHRRKVARCLAEAKERVEAARALVGRAWEQFHRVQVSAAGDAEIEAAGRRIDEATVILAESERAARMEEKGTRHAEELVREARKELAAALREATPLTRMEERERRAHRREQERREEQRLDDLPRPAPAAGSGG